MNALLWLALPLASQARSHSVEARLSEGRAVWSQAAIVAEGSTGQFSGPVRAASGTRMMIVNASLTRENSGAARVEYQLELSGHPDSEGKPAFQVQGAVALRPGEAVFLADCSGQRAELALDARKDAAARDASAALGNRYVRASLGGADPLRCRFAALPGSQVNVATTVEAHNKLLRQSLVNALLTERADGAFDLQYQLVHAPRGRAAADAMGTERLEAGRRVVAGGVELIVEGTAPVRRSEPAAAGTPRGAVPLLR